MSTIRERILQEAALSKQAVRYHVLGIACMLAITVVGIPLMIIVLPITDWYYTKYYKNLRVILTSRDLKVHRGILVKEVKTIPLEKITDLRVYQGPIMRWMGLKGLAVETAGQTNQAGALVSIIGIEDTDQFRDTALNQRDRITDQDDESSASAASPAPAASGAPTKNGAMLETLTDIRDTLKRIEQSIQRE